MHEASLVARLLSVAEDEAGRHGFSRIKGLRLRVGVMRQAVPELMETAFAVLSRGTLAEGADLQIELVPLRVRCAECCRESEVEPWSFACPHCAAPASEVLAGQELTLVEMDGEL